MKKALTFSFLSKHFNKNIYSFNKENKKIIIQFIISFFFFSIGIWFLMHERNELQKVENVLINANKQWIITGVLLTMLYILLQAQMYVFSFSAIHKKISFANSFILFIKRNFISVFLPAGGISSLGFYTGAIEKTGIKKTQIHFASSIYGFTGIFSVIIVAFPAFIFSILYGKIDSNEWLALISVMVIIAVSYFFYKSIIRKGFFYNLIIKQIPAAEVFLNDIQTSKINENKFLLTILSSVLIEFIGIATVYIAMLALNYNPSLYAATMAYLISVIFLIVSPFLRGLGAVEISMSFILIKLGFQNEEAIAITLFYRFFEFWLPLLIGLLTFISKINKILMRILPAVFLTILGVTNIISVLTPAISERVVQLKHFIPIQIIYASNYLILLTGFLLLITAVFLLKGLRNAWWFALSLSIISLIGHLTKAIDYEESIVAFIVIVLLTFSRKEYYVKSNPKLRNIGLQTSLLLTIIVLIYGMLGFYFIDKKHFNIDFTILQSLRYTIQNYFLIGSSDLVPLSSFAKYFIYSINISGLISISILVYTLIKRYVPQKNISDEELSLAQKLLNDFGNSSLDYFKTYFDKIIFFSKSKKAFVSYKISGSYAVVLENPVAESASEFETCIKEFNRYCFENGLKSIYYRVSENVLPIYKNLHLKELFIGQEGIVNASDFTLSGNKKKSLRNAINKVKAQGNKAVIYNPPIKDGILQKIKSVSDEWLQDTGRKEIVFSQGMFLWDELKKQTILTIENEEEKIIAFINIIPDYAKNEITYDLIRKTKDAPNGVLDYILIELFNYAKTKQIDYVNLGFAPLSGLNDPHTFPEKSMKFAYEKIKSFAQYKGLREYKDKFNPVWYNKYLIYQHDYDLLQIPSVLTNVIKP
ncbi:MAG: flippase-like domain-containing protein [Bacteroidales bacterium]|nr:flippase-like domain-containing protein [Bacteroidales bacterium]